MNKITLTLLVSASSLRDMMRTKVTSFLTTGLTLLVLAPTAFAQEDAGFTALEKSAEGLQEAILMTASKLVQVYGGDAVGPATLTFNGIFTDGSWQADFSGDYAGEPVALDFTGTYDDSKNAGAFTVTGTYGSGTWDGDGSWRYDLVDPQTIHMFWDSAASIIDGIGRLFKPDKHFTTPKRWAMSQLPDGRWHEVDYGTTYFGFPVGPIKKEISDWVHPPGGRRGGIAAITASLPDDGIQLSGSADFDVGTFTGMVNLTPVPEAKGEEAFEDEDKKELIPEIFVPEKLKNQVKDLVNNITGKIFTMEELDELARRIIEAITVGEAKKFKGVDATSNPLKLTKEQKDIVDRLINALGSDALARKAQAAYEKAKKDKRIE